MRARNARQTADAEAELTLKIKGPVLRSRAGPFLRRLYGLIQVERVDITLPRRGLRRLDDMARAAGQSRSGLIARLTVAPSTKGRRSTVDKI